MSDHDETPRIIRAGCWGKVPGDGPIAVKADGSKVPALVAEHNFPPGYEVPAHVHENGHEIIHVIDGVLVITAPGGETTYYAGAAAEIPRGHVHGLRNAGKGRLRILAICIPAVPAEVPMPKPYARGALAPETVMGIGGG